MDQEWRGGKPETDLGGRADNIGRPVGPKWSSKEAALEDCGRGDLVDGDIVNQEK